MFAYLQDREPFTESPRLLMPLFETPSTEEEEIVGTDAATRALSVAVVENDFVERVYEKLAHIYDFTFGPVLHPGRIRAVERMNLGAGDHVLEVGVGTGINIPLYPGSSAVTGIDLSASMLEHARRLAAPMSNVRLLEMDAADLKFADNSFDVVYAPYVISVVPDPLAVVREMQRVCRPGGKIIILNHFLSANRVLAWFERAISPFTVHIGFKADLDLQALIAQAELEPVSIEKINFPRIWSLVTCIKG
jgi:phosphatidylethanolamine/phosphatidyl-N-methylethanolamine N-methyltransferase